MTLLALLLAVSAFAQSQQSPDYSVGYVLPPENNFASLPSGGRLTYPPAGVNRTVTATLVIANRGTTRGAVNSISVSGAPFVPTGLPPFPAALEPGRELRIGIVFAPRQSGRFTGSLAIAFDSASFRAELAGNTAPAEPSLSYVLASEGNVIPVNSGATVLFPPTRLNTAASAVINLTNRGLGGGTITGVSVAGDRFRLTGLGSLPVFVDAGLELRFGLIFEARDIEPATGQLKIVIDDRTLVLNLEGRGSGARFTYQVIDPAPFSDLRANGKLALPDTTPGQTSALTIEVRNTGNAEGSVAGISAVGEGFQLSNLPFFPQPLPPESALWFQVVFAPKSPGTATGRLRIGLDTFDLEATAKGPLLVYSYRTGATAIPIRDNKSVLWAPVQLGQSSRIELLLRNNGNMPATVAAMLVVDSRAAFKAVDTPPLPATIEAGAELPLPILFSPLTAGDYTARLYLGDEIFNLVGTGAPLPPLPRVDLRGPARMQNPLEQRSIALTLAEPYPLPLTGALTLAVNSGSLNVDPAVQFSTGGRIAPFTIAAGETRAMFQGRPEVFFQTGSVAATITFQASFAARGVNITPDAAPAMEALVAPAPPQVLDIQLEPRSSNTLSVVVTGLATTRALDQLELQFAASPKYNVPAGKFTLDISALAASWYRRRDSEAYGSLFTATVPFTVQSGSLPDLEEVFQSVSATLVNSLGRSNTLSTTPRP